MAFERGKSGNAKGRPTKEEQALRGLTPTDLDPTVRRLKRAVPQSIDLIIKAMEDEESPVDKRTKHAKTIIDLYFKGEVLKQQLKKTQEVVDEVTKPEITETEGSNVVVLNWDGNFDDDDDENNA